MAAKSVDLTASDEFLFSLDVSSDYPETVRISKRDSATLQILHRSLAVPSSVDASLILNNGSLSVSDKTTITQIDAATLRTLRSSFLPSSALYSVTIDGIWICSSDGTVSLNGEQTFFNARKTLKIGEKVIAVFSPSSSSTVVCITNYGQCTIFTPQESSSSNLLSKADPENSCCCFAKKPAALAEVTAAFSAGDLLLLTCSDSQTLAFSLEDGRFERIKFPKNFKQWPIRRLFSSGRDIYLSHGTDLISKIIRKNSDLEIYSCSTRSGGKVVISEGRFFELSDLGQIRLLEISRRPELSLPSGAKIEALASGQILYSKNSKITQLSVSFTPVEEISRPGEYWLSTNAVPPFLPIWSEISEDNILATPQLRQNLPTAPGNFSIATFNFLLSGEASPVALAPKFVFGLGKQVGEPMAALEAILAGFQPGKLQPLILDRLLPLLDTSAGLNDLLEILNEYDKGGEINFLLNSIFLRKSQTAKRQSADLEFARRNFKASEKQRDDFASFLRLQPQGADIQPEMAKGDGQEHQEEEPSPEPLILPAEDSLEILWRRGREFLMARDEPRALACFTAGLKISKNSDPEMFKKFAKYRCLTNGFALAKKIKDPSTHWASLIRLPVEEAEGAAVTKLAVESSMRARKLRVAHSLANYLIETYEHGMHLKPEEVLKFNLISASTVHASPGASEIRCPVCRQVLENSLDENCTRCESRIFLCAKQFRLIKETDVSICQDCDARYETGLKCPGCRI